MEKVDSLRDATFTRKTFFVGVNSGLYAEAEGQEMPRKLLNLARFILVGQSPDTYVTGEDYEAIN